MKDSPRLGFFSLSLSHSSCLFLFLASKSFSETKESDMFILFLFLFCLFSKMTKRSLRLFNNIVINNQRLSSIVVRLRALIELLHFLNELMVFNSRFSMKIVSMYCHLWAPSFSTRAYHCSFLTFSLLFFYHLVFFFFHKRYWTINQLNSSNWSPFLKFFEILVVWPVSNL